MGKQLSERQKQGMFMCAGLGIGFLAGVFIAFGPRIQWNAGSEGAAAWLQALGTLTAIVITWYIATRARKIEDERRSYDLRLRARNHALAVLLPVFSWNQRWKNVRQALNQANDGGESRALTMLIEFPRYLEFPRELIRLKAVTHEFGDAAHSIQELFHWMTLLVETRHIIERVVNGDYGDGGQKQIEIVQMVDRAARSLRTATGQLEALFMPEE